MATVSERGIAVVTGASHGIGRETCLVLGARGFRLCGMGLGASDIEETRAEARARGIALELVEGDVSRKEDVDRLRRVVADTGGPVRALVNNAAVRPVGTVLTTTDEDWDRVFAVNVKGTFLVTRAILPMIVDSGGGSIVNISSCSAMGGPNLIAYSSSKAAILAFTRCLAEDHKQQRVRANAILPGPTLTGMTENLPKELLDWCAANGVQNRMAKPADIAAAVAFLVSDEAETVSGTELRVNYWPALFG
jgi:NAD(P)-dependent dehydrogenase (short-subunit alcohol dehydrogenase family)